MNNLRSRINRLRRETVEIRNEVYELTLGEYAEDHAEETAIIAVAEEELDTAQLAMMHAVDLLGDADKLSVRD